LPDYLTRLAARSLFLPIGRLFDFQQNQHDLNLTWQVKDGYYLYRNR
jgi:thiol:disulfide interchange protein DsbD